jgi:hypothetical protein
MTMSTPDHTHPDHEIPIGEVTPRPARRWITASLFVCLGLAWVLQGLGVIGWVNHFNHKIDSRGQTRDEQRQADIADLRATQAKLAQQQTQINQLNHRLSVTVQTTHDSLCSVAIALHERDPQDDLVTNFGRANGCF